MKNTILFAIAYYALTAAPVMADPKQAPSPDDTTGGAAPMIVDLAKIKVEKVGNLAGQQPAGAKPGKKDEEKVPADEEPEDDGDETEDAKRRLSRSMWHAGAQITYGTRNQGAGVQFGYSGFGESARAGMVGGWGTDSVKLDASLSNVRTGLKASKRTFGVAGVFNGDASIGSSGHGNFLATGGAGLVIRPMREVRIVPQLGFGAGYADTIGSGMDKKKGVESISVGPEAGVGVGVKHGPFNAMLNVYAIMNAAQKENPTVKQTQFLGVGEIEGRYALTDRAAIFLNGKVLGELRGTKYTVSGTDALGGAQATVGFSYTLGHSNGAHKAEEEKKDNEPKEESTSTQ